MHASAIIERALVESRGHSSYNQRGAKTSASVAARPPTPVQIHVDMTRPERSPTGGQREVVPSTMSGCMCQPSGKLNRCERQTCGRKDTPTICIQLTSGGFSTPSPVVVAQSVTRIEHCHCAGGIFRLVIIPERGGAKPR